MDLRFIGSTGILVSPIAMGCWPITGITSIDVTMEQSLATLKSALDAGINFFDTAYIYGFHGESERMIAQALGQRRQDIVIASKCGLHWESPGKQARDGSPDTLRRQCQESLQRLNTDYLDLLYLHAPDPKVPISESAEALCGLLQAGKTRSVGVSNVTLEQMKEFASVCPLSAYQPHYNMLQREIESSQLPWCREQQISVFVYWPLLKGLLAGKLARDHVFSDQDGRKKYPMFQGQEYQKNLDFVDELRAISSKADCTVAQLVLSWTIHQPGITGALVGAKRPDQIRENAGGMAVELSQEIIEDIDSALARRGQPRSRSAV